MQDKPTQNYSASEIKRSAKNRKRSKKRSIFCEIHGCYLESASPKYRLSALKTENEQEREKLNESLLSLLEVPECDDIQKNWIESFWCPQCRQRRWYHITQTELRCYRSQVLSDGLCRQLERQE